MSIGTKIFNKEQMKRTTRQLRKRLVEPDRILICVIEKKLVPAIRLDANFFGKLYSAGEVDFTSQIKVYHLYPHFFAELSINWKNIDCKVRLTFNFCRDQGWLALLCVAKKIAFVSEQFGGKAIVVGNLITNVLWNSLAFSLLVRAPKQGVIMNDVERWTW